MPEHQRNPAGSRLWLQQENDRLRARVADLEQQRDKWMSDSVEGHRQRDHLREAARKSDHRHLALSRLQKRYDRTKRDLRQQSEEKERLKGLVVGMMRVCRAADRVQAALGKGAVSEELRAELAQAIEDAASLSTEPPVSGRREAIHRALIPHWPPSPPSPGSRLDEAVDAVLRVTGSGNGRA